ncbi:ArsR/SmtB family transcription factor [Candidatus Phycosocius spiralis]|uniref:ArsR family transcriptional regulator n=1 Tax=Candidatus Phycosocius spiralis TaxID=2815099 RepID=A0ABQ4PSN0_9PROT|nr:metalloregulator ArsR/SmtB family transcription factor [Candidatus Phycosocius spiralis]GIU66017.1 ArsR family transcriptional regulator [Candidatus Phycosocius spiralis]
MDQIVDIVRAIGEPTRMRILVLLARGELAAGEMSTVLNQSQPRVSRHLKLLAEAGLLERRPEGAWVFFRLNTDRVAGRIVRAILEEMPKDDIVLMRDQDRLAQVQAQREELARAYFETAADEWNALRRLHQPEAAVEAALTKIVTDQRFDLHIDLGSGTGRMIELFAGQAKRSEGVDTSRKMLALARARLDNSGSGQASVRQADILGLPYDDASADLVTIHQVLHYLPEPFLAIKEAARILKPGGTLLIADFAPHGFEELRERHAHRRLGFGDQEVMDWCEQAGLATLSVEHVAPVAGETGLAVTIWKATDPKAVRNRDYVKIKEPRIA